MDTIAKAFLAEIDQFLQKAGVDPTALASRPWVILLRLRPQEGRSPSTRTMERVRAWMQQQRIAVAPTKPHPAASFNPPDLS